MSNKLTHLPNSTPRWYGGCAENNPRSVARRRLHKTLHCNAMKNSSEQVGWTPAICCVNVWDSCVSKRKMSFKSKLARELYDLVEDLSGCLFQRSITHQGVDGHTVTPRCLRLLQYTLLQKQPAKYVNPIYLVTFRIIAKTSSSRKSW